VTNSNVKDGMFTYTSSGILARHTAVNVTYNDKNDRFLPKIVSEDTATGITRYGYNLAEVAAFGCTSEGQARRVAKWYLDTEMNQLETVSYETSFNQADLIPGDVIYVMDNDYVSEVFAGRIVDGTTTQVITDAPVVLNSATTYTLTLLDLDGSTLVERTITNAAGTYTTFNLNTALPNSATNLKGREWMITSAADVSARQFKVIGIKESEKGIFSITAVFHDPGKYDRVESSLVNPSLVYSSVASDVCGPVSGITGTLEARVDNVLGPLTSLRVSWTEPTTPSIMGYKVSYSRNSGPLSTQETVHNNEFYIDGASEGTYFISVIAYNMKGVQSPPTVQTLTVGYNGTNSLYPPTALTISSGHGSGNEWYGPDLFFGWTPNSLNDNIVGSTVGGYLVKIYDNATSTLIHSETVGKLVTSMDYTMSENVRDGGPFRALRVEVYTLNAYNQASTNFINQVFTNSAPAIPSTFTATSGTMQYKVNITVSSPVADQQGLIIYQGTTAGFTPDTSNIVYDGAVYTGSDGITIPQAVTGSYYVKAAIYDTFGKTGLNYTSGVAVSSYALGGVTAPAVPTGLTLTAFLDQAPNGSQTGRIVATWNSQTTNTTSYEVRIRDITGSGQYSSIITSSVTQTWSGLKVGNQYGVQVQARNADVGSGYTSEITSTTPGDTTLPSDPSALTVTSSFKNNWLSWTKSTAVDLRGTEVWASATNDRTAATLITITGDNTFVHSGLSTGTTRYYWVRSVDTSGNFSGYYPSSSTAGVVGTTIGTATADYQNLSINNAAIANLAVDTAKIADLAVSGAKIGTATIDTLNLKNGSISDVKAYVDNTPVVISSATLSNGSNTYSYNDTEVFNFVFNTANPTTSETSFFTYFHAFCTYDVYSSSDVYISNLGIISGTSKLSVSAQFVPTYRVQIVKTSDSSVVYTSPSYSGAAAVNLKSVYISNLGIIDTGANLSINIVGGNGQNILFGTVNLLKNTQYKLQVIVNAGSWSYTNTTGTAFTLQVRAVNKTAYIQTILR
jgi:hypothetical protein